MTRVLPAFTVLLIALPGAAAELPDGAQLRFGEAKLQGFSVERAAAISPDGKLVATGGANSPVQVWDVASGKLLYDHGITGSVFDLRWTAIGKLVGLTFFGHDGFFMARWDGEKDKGLTDQEYQKLRRDADNAPKRGGYAGRTALSEDGRRVAVLRQLDKDERKIEVHDFKPNTPSVLVEPKLVLSLPRCEGVWLSRDGNTLLAHQDHPQNVRQLSAFDLTAKTPDESVWQVTLPRDPHGPQYVFSDGKRAVVQYPFGKTELWDGPKGEKLRTLDLKYFSLGGQVEVPAVALSPDGKRVAIGQRAESGLMGGEVIDFESGKTMVTLTPHPLPRAGELRFSPDGKKLVRTSYGAVRLWDAASGTDASPITGHVGPVRSVAVAGDGKTVVTAGADLTVRGWSPDTGKELWRLDFAQEITVRQLAPDLAVLLGSGSTAVPKPLLTLTTGQARALPAGMAEKRPVAVSADGKTAVTADWATGAIGVWDWPAGKQRFAVALEPPAKLSFAGVREVRLSPDGKQLLAVVDYVDLSVPEGLRARPRLPFRERWDLATEKRLEQVGDPPRAPSALVSNGKRFLVVQGDGTVSDAISGAGVGKLGSDGQYRFDFQYRAGVALSPDGKTLAVANGWASDGAIHLFDVATGKAVTRKAGGRAGNIPAFLPDGRLVSAGESVLVWAK